ncbi:hypothetical protein ACOSQ3_004641 [Xanthoceras sorbifolium]
MFESKFLLKMMVGIGVPNGTHAAQDFIISYRQVENGLITILFNLDSIFLMCDIDFCESRSNKIVINPFSTCRYDIIKSWATCVPFGTPIPTIIFNKNLLSNI